jgi:cobalamin biosynthesis Mg chelatase CobN
VVPANLELYDTLNLVGEIKRYAAHFHHFSSVSNPALRVCPLRLAAMAIIDRKLNEEAQREAAEYAERNDTAAAPHWDESMPPPPTYEEAVPSSSTGSPAQGQNGRQNTSEASAASSSSRDPRRSRRSERLSTDTDSVESDESMPLLTNRQKRRLKRKMRSVDRMKKGCRFIGASLLLACVVVLILKLVRLSRREIVRLNRWGRSDYW